MSDATWDYVTGQLRPDLPATLERFARASAAVVPDRADVGYGAHARQVFDLFVSPAPWRGTVAYFHAGFWQGRDKAQFRFIVPGLLRHGIDVALCNYPLCPEVTLPELVAAALPSVPRVLAAVAALGRGGRRLLAAGHSAGGHIVTELALAGQPIGAVGALSGVFELAPLLDTPLNDKLRLDAATAQAMSPLHWLRPGLPPALFAAGGAETAAFQAQTAAMQAAWATAGNEAAHSVVAEADHFTLLDEFGRDGPLMEHVVRLARIGSA